MAPAMSKSKGPMGKSAAPAKGAPAAAGKSAAPAAAGKTGPPAKSAPAAAGKSAAAAAMNKSAAPAAMNKSAAPAAMNKSAAPAAMNKSAAPAAMNKSAAPAASSPAAANKKSMFPTATQAPAQAAGTMAKMEQKVVVTVMQVEKKMEEEFKATEGFVESCFRGLETILPCGGSSANAAPAQDAQQQQQQQPKMPMRTLFNPPRVNVGSIMAPAGQHRVTQSNYLMIPTANMIPQLNPVYKMSSKPNN